MPATPHVILFEHTDFHGAHKHAFASVRDLAKCFDRTVLPEMSDMNDKTSSIVVLEGRWEFFRNHDFNDSLGVLGPGAYADIKTALVRPGEARREDVGDNISSMRSLG